MAKTRAELSEIVEAKLAVVDAQVEARLERTRTDILTSGATVDIDHLDETIAESRAEWAAMRLKLRDGVLAAAAGNWEPIETLCAAPRSRADDDAPSGPAWIRL